MKTYSSHKELNLDQLVSYSMRKRISLEYSLIEGTTVKTNKINIAFNKCSCTEGYSDPNCKNRFSYKIDYIDGEAITLKECPNKFNDFELWNNIYIALNEIKSIDKVNSFYGIPFIELPNNIYCFLNSVFAAKERYNQDKQDSESK